MGFNIINDKNEVIGWTAERFTLPDGQRLVADDVQTKPSLTEVRTARTTAIATQVRRLIDDSAWRAERAAERDLLGLEGETPQEVYAYREAVRRAGDRAEREIEQLNDIEQINNYELKILPSDYPQIGALTQLQFLRRFTADERTAITKLRAKNAQINDYFTLLELAKFINPYDQDVILGVNMLEQLGIIGQGRAGQILNGEAV